MIQEKNSIPMTIEQLINRYGLSYPFILQKAVSETKDTAYGVNIPCGCTVTFLQRVTGNIHEGWVERNGFQVLDTPSWLLVESSGSNVVVLSTYKSSRRRCRRPK